MYYNIYFKINIKLKDKNKKPDIWQNFYERLKDIKVILIIIFLELIIIIYYIK